MSKILITGFSESRGIAKQGTGRPYTILRLFPLAPMRGWENDHGSSVGFGFASDDNKSFNVADDAQLIGRLKNVPYPSYLELIRSDDPNDPTKMIVTDFKVVGDPVKLVLA